MKFSRETAAVSNLGMSKVGGGGEAYRITTSQQKMNIIENTMLRFTPEFCRKRMVIIFKPCSGFLVILVAPEERLSLVPRRQRI